ncbi:hypothetical protein A3A05_02065 [Candidatus Nomurabacteria bacterium RIFCSPLOWO2_01_FULL_41_12]|uniref:4-fold beta flower domain-containing protein n=1 Tax=Candidatus Nomurabacteria bacterium RIFCSPLOWO2_01_FULL_41_12 TaxID=1801774 RepID=A0A1F6WVR2_9BACT|nr:MAG: hypothetical protein A3A05_02065 [Candidatus Nomurabacteria bacterium RIFCSPLOWO2_01_FULL_41_12]
MYIFRLSGEYIGFIKNNVFYSTNGSYLGWVEDGHVWDKNGQYRGKLTILKGNNYITKDSFLVDPSPRPSRAGESIEQEQPQLNIDPADSEFNFKDGF